jgi:hypothetical protein
MPASTPPGGDAHALAPHHLEMGNTPPDAFRVVEDAPRMSSALASAASAMAPAPPPPLPRRRMLLGALLLAVGIAAAALGASEAQPLLQVAGALAIVPGLYVVYLVVAVYALRRRDLYDELT